MLSIKNGILKQNESSHRYLAPIIVAYLLAQPLIDVATSFLVRFTDYDLTIGMVLRVVFLLLAVIYCIFVSRSGYKKWFIGYIILFIVFSAAFLLYMLLAKNSSVFFSEIKSLLKCFYFPLLMMCLITIFDGQEKKIEPQSLILPGIIYIGLILLAIVTGTGFISYNHNKLGTTGWFYAANETGNIISVIFPVLVFYIIVALEKINVKRIMVSVLVLFIYLGVSLNIGTKVPLISAIISFAVVFIVYIIRAFLLKEKKRPILISVISLGLIVITLLALPYTAAGKNLSQHMKTANVNSISDFFDVDASADNGNSSTDKTDNSTNVIMSSRDVYLERTAKEFDEDAILTKLLGMGSTVINGDGIKSYRSIEMDFYDIFYQFGVIGFAVYFAPVLVILIIIVIKALKRFKASVCSDTIIGYLIGLVLGFGIAYIAGHVFTAPAVSVYLAMFIASLFATYMEKEPLQSAIKQTSGVLSTQD